MKLAHWGGIMLVLLAGFSLVAGGCNQAENKGGQAEKKAAEEKTKKADDAETWWCKEHGIPEHDCAQCSAKVAAEYKKKGDWCKEHDRPESQCFICHPELKEKFAALYRARYGKEPPPIEEDPKEEQKKEGAKK